VESEEEEEEGEDEALQPSESMPMQRTLTWQQQQQMQQEKEAAEAARKEQEELGARKKASADSKARIEENRRKKAEKEALREAEARRLQEGEERKMEEVRTKMRLAAEERERKRQAKREAKIKAEAAALEEARQREAYENSRYRQQMRRTKSQSDDVLTAEQEKLKELYEKIDSDNSGGITIHELQLNMAELEKDLELDVGVPTMTLIRLMHAAEEGKKDDKLDFQEFLKFSKTLQEACSKVKKVAQRNDSQSQRIEQSKIDHAEEHNIWKVLDINNDGTIGVDEIRYGDSALHQLCNFLGVDHDSANNDVIVNALESAYEDGDTDGSGVVDWDEFLPMMKAFRAIAKTNLGF